MSLYNLYETDHDVEKGGVILNYGEGVRIKVARAGGQNVDFGKCIERLTRQHRDHKGNLTGISDTFASELWMQAYAESVVKDWEGVSDREGKPLKFSPENCVKLFKDLPDLFADVRAAAENISNFLADKVEEDAKN